MVSSINKLWIVYKETEESKKKLKGIKAKAVTNDRVGIF